MTFGATIARMKTPLLALLLIATNAFAAHCEGAKPCEKMWSDAQEAVGIVSNMRIRLLTDSRIETYAANDFGRVGVTVTKTPNGDGYDINAHFDCYGLRCPDEVQDAHTKAFDSLIAPKP